MSYKLLGFWIDDLIIMLLEIVLTTNIKRTLSRNLLNQKKVLKILHLKRKHLFVITIISITINLPALSALML